MTKEPDGYIIMSDNEREELREFFRTANVSGLEERTSIWTDFLNRDSGSRVVLGPSVTELLYEDLYELASATEDTTTRLNALGWLRELEGDNRGAELREMTRHESTGPGR